MSGKQTQCFPPTSVIKESFTALLSRESYKYFYVRQEKNIDLYIINGHFLSKTESEIDYSQQKNTKNKFPYQRPINSTAPSRRRKRHHKNFQGTPKGGQNMGGVKVTASSSISRVLALRNRQS